MKNNKVAVPLMAQESKVGCDKAGSVNLSSVAEIVSGGGAPKPENTASQGLKEHEENCDCCIATQGCELKSEVSPPVASRLNERSASTQEPKEESERREK